MPQAGGGEAGIDQESSNVSTIRNFEYSQRVHAVFCPRDDRGV